MDKAVNLLLDWQLAEGIQDSDARRTCFRKTTDFFRPMPEKRELRVQSRESRVEVAAERETAEVEPGVSPRAKEATCPVCRIPVEDHRSTSIQVCAAPGCENPVKPGRTFCCRAHIVAKGRKLNLTPEDIAARTQRVKAAQQKHLAARKNGAQPTPPVPEPEPESPPSETGFEKRRAACEHEIEAFFADNGMITSDQERALASKHNLALGVVEKIVTQVGRRMMEAA